MAIDPIAAKALAAAVNTSDAPFDAIQKPGETSGGGFVRSLEQWLESVDTAAGNANDAVNAMIGGTGDVHHAMLALQRAETMLELTVQVRNKLVQAYQDIMRMPM
jgi:flagellar hook-basal body complex protein FliE